MVRLPQAVAALTAALCALPSGVAGLYEKDSPVLQLTPKTYETLIAKSNYTSIVEFYAPWCGHCQRLAPEFNKAASNLKGIAKVAAIDCDEDSNKGFCGGMGVQGFPTLKIVRPSKDPKRYGKPTVEDYQGARKGKAIVDAVVGAMPNYVKRITDKQLEETLSKDNESTKAFVYSDKGTTAPMTMALAIDFLDSIKFFQIRDNQKESVAMFDIDKWPSIVVLPGGAAEAVLYDGKMHKSDISDFLSTFKAPNPDASGKPADSKKKSGGSGSSSSSSAKAKASEEAAPPAPKLPVLETAEAFEAACLTPKSATCILLMLDSQASSQTDDPAAPLSLKSLAAFAAKRGKALPSLYAIPAGNDGGSKLLKALKLADDHEKLIAVNGKKGWWRRFTPATEGGDFDARAAESWLDDITMGDGKKEKLPEGVIVEEVVKGEANDKVTEENTEEPRVEEEKETEEPVKINIDEEVIEKKQDEHDEL